MKKRRKAFRLLTARGLFIARSLIFTACKGDEQKQDVPGVPGERGGGLTLMAPESYSYTDFATYSLQNGYDSSANLIVTDYSGRATIYLSSDLSVDPQTPESTSYIPDVYGQIDIACMRDRLLIVKTSIPQNISWFDEKALGRLITVDFNGANQKTAYTFSRADFVLRGPMARGDGCVYMILATFDEESKSYDRVELVKIDLDNGEKSVILSDLPCRNPPVIAGAVGDTILLKYFILPDPDLFWATNTKSLTYQFCRVDINTKEMRTVYEMPYSFGKEVWRDDRLLIVLNEEKGVFALNIETGERDRVADLSDFAEEHSDFVIEQYIDGHLIMQAEKEDETEYFRLDMESGLISPLTLKDRDGNLPGILGVGDDEYLVISGNKIVTIYPPDPLGNGEPTQVRAPVYSMILKADYWAGVHNFIEITDYVYG